jgi:hypothetical protein
LKTFSSPISSLLLQVCSPLSLLICCRSNLQQKDHNQHCTRFSKAARK